MKINGETSFACLLGSPVAHSLSPAMHSLAFELCGVNGVYLAFDVAPERLESAFCGLKELGCMGFNLTMPHKRDIIPYLDSVSQVSSLCGAVNTVVLRDGEAFGTTTDGVGFYDSLLHEEGIDLAGKKMVLLGAGGAAVAIAAEGAVGRLGELSIFRRKNERWNDTLGFVERLNNETSCAVRLFDIANEHSLKDEIEGAAVVCNATNVGMGDDTSSPIGADVISPGVHVADIIYHPEVTPLMSEAKKAGAPSSNGKYMLLYQGAASFELWTGKTMPVDEIKRRVFDS